jgi:cell division protein FtsW
MSATTPVLRKTIRSAQVRLPARINIPLLLLVAALICLGLTMVASASVSISDRLTGDPLYYFHRQLVFVGVGLIGMVFVYRVPLAYWEKTSRILLVAAFLLLIFVLVPGIGKTVNGSSRWLAVGPLTLQISEFAKLLTIVYFASYLVRRDQQLHERPSEFIRPVAITAFLSGLLLGEPDFGAAVVLVTTVLGMLLLGGVRLWQFTPLVLMAGATLVFLALSSPYRLERITTFLNPWGDPYDSGFQLTQSLIAIGSGGWFGVGLGGSVQKLFYLPEAHTDFLFAVLAEELGLLGVIVVVTLYTALMWQGYKIGHSAEIQGMKFAAYLSYGIIIWLGVQVYINMGVNMGLLPTKGLTLPMMSAGGSSMLAMCTAIGLLLRVHRETVDRQMPSATSYSVIRKESR